MTKENSNQFPNLVDFIEELQNPSTYKKISEMIKKDLSNSYVRVEVICDRKGFWLKPHCDIKEKLMSCLLFVNKHNDCLLYTSPSPRDISGYRMPSSA